MNNDKSIQLGRKENKEKQEKIVPPTPPLRIKDINRDLTYIRLGFLGEGGFARVYEVQDQNNKHRALKVVAKSSIKSRRNKTKLWAEIKLHQMLAHPNIVRFDDCFEDHDNVYMIIELCHNGSLMDLLRRRRRLTEPEARYYLVQIIGACQYMHQTNVIHRDLKLGNIFLNENMDLKIGDFGLAALIEKPGDRKKTICGTPNYIAPEILFDTANGHSFEVDIWSVGVILYTLLIGKPPFQTKDVKAIYKRIKENRYEFPEEKPISELAEDLIVKVLNQDPVSRPTFDYILKHPFMYTGPFPPYLPASIHEAKPDFSYISTSSSRRHFTSACQKAHIGASLPIKVPTDPSFKTKTALGPSIIQQEKDFRNAIQPGSPVSALLKSARQPLLQTSAPITEAGLLRKLNAAGAQSTLSPARRTAYKENRGITAGPSRQPAVQKLGNVEEAEEEEAEEEEELLHDVAPKQNGYNAGIRERELATQKARIVSQMANACVPNIPSGLSPRKTVAAPAPPPQPRLGYNQVKPHPTIPKQKRSLLDTVLRNLSKCLDKAQNNETFQIPDIPLVPSPPRVFVVSWLDYCDKYGMGFVLSDGTVTVHFNDTSSLALAPGKQYFDSIEPAKGGDLDDCLRSNHHIDQHSPDLRNKVYLLKHFAGYMENQLTGDQPFIYRDESLTKGMIFITRYLRMKHVIMFRLSNDVLQFNFYDHTKLILSEGGFVISMIDKNHVLWTWSLQVLLNPISDDVSDRERRRMEGAVHKIGYARDVLSRIISHNRDKPTAKAPTDAGRQREVPQVREMKPIR